MNKQLSINESKHETEALIYGGPADMKTYSHRIRLQCNFKKSNFKNMCSKITDNLI